MRTDRLSRKVEREDFPKFIGKAGVEKTDFIKNFSDITGMESDLAEK